MNRKIIILVLIAVTILDIMLVYGAVHLVKDELENGEIKDQLKKTELMEAKAGRILMEDTNVRQLLENNDEFKVCTFIKDSSNVDLFYLIGNNCQFVGNKTFYNIEDSKLFKFSVDLANEKVITYSLDSTDANDSDLLITLSIQDKITADLDNTLVESTFFIHNHPIYWSASKNAWIYRFNTSGEALVMPTMSSSSGAGGFDDYTTLKEIYNKKQFSIDSQKVQYEFDPSDMLDMISSSMGFRNPYTSESHEIKVNPDQTVMSDLEASLEIDEWGEDVSDLSHEWYIVIHAPPDPGSLSPVEIEKYGIWEDQYGNYYCSGCVLVAKGAWLKSSSDEMTKANDRPRDIMDMESPEGINVTFESHLGGTVSAVAISEGYACVGQGQDLVVLNVKDASNPVEMGRVTTPSNVNEIVVADNFAYLACKDTGLVIADISEPAKPELITIFDTAENALAHDVNGVAVFGYYAYVADGANGLAVIDIRDPSKPKIAGTYDGLRANDIVVSGNYAYLTDGSKGLMILDVTHPSRPTLAGNYSITDYACGVAVSGNYAYVTGFNNGTIYCVDIHEPAAPVLAGSYDAVGRTKSIAVSGNNAFVSSSEGLLIFNIIDSTAIVSVGNYSTDISSNIVVSGKYAYVADDASGLSIIDISHPAVPQLTGSYDNAFSAGSVTVSGNYAYVAAYGDGLLITDISDPANPAIIGSYDFNGSAADVSISGDYAYVASYNEGLLIFDISEPTEPKLTGSYNPNGIIGSGHFNTIAVSGNYVYIGSKFYGLFVIDVSNPTSPKLTDSYRCEAYGVDVSGNYAYVAAYRDGLLIIDASEPNSLDLAGSYNADGFANDVTVSGTNAYVTYTYSNFEYSAFFIIDIINPSAPKLAGSYDTHCHESHGVDVFDNYAYVADYFNGLVIVDVSEPSAPRIVCAFDTAGDLTHNLAISGNYVYTADSNNGLVTVSTNAPSG